MSLKRRFTGVAAGAAMLLTGATAGLADNTNYSNDNRFDVYAGTMVAQDAATPEAPNTTTEEIVVDAQQQQMMDDIQAQLQTIYEVASIVYQAAYVELTGEELTAMIWDSVPDNQILATGGDVSFVPTTPNELLNALQIIYVNYVYANDLNAGDYTAELLNTFLGKLDAHSAYHPPVSFENVQEFNDGTFGGLGVSMNVNAQEGYFEITGFADMVGGTPAENAGIHIGDRVTHIDGVSVTDLDGDALANALRGVPGSDVELTVTRQGEANPLAITVTRAAIVQNPVASRTLAGGQIGYMRLSSFTGQAERGITEAIEELENAATPPSSYILDLRFNPGGLVNQATDIIDDFIEDGDILSAQQRGGRTSAIVAQPGDMINGKPLIILVNNASASASEIVSGVLQHYDRATIIGSRSFGKGSMQTIIPLRSTSGAGLRLTTALYLIANSHSIQGQGVTPDITVTFGAATLIDSERRNEADMTAVIDNTITPDAVDNSDHMQCVPNADEADILNNVGDMFVFVNRVTGDRYLDSTLLCAVEEALGVEQNTRRQPDPSYVAPQNAPAVPAIAAPAPSAP